MVEIDHPRPNSRAALIEAAFEEFSTKGYEATTVSEIAQRAGVTTGALYAHFTGKLDLLLATTGLMPVEEVMRSMADLASLPWNEAPRSISRNMVEPAPRLTLLLDVIVSARRDPHVAGVLRRGLEAYLDAGAEAIRTGTALGLTDPALEPDDLSRFFALLNLGTIAFAALEERPLDEEALARVTAIVLQVAGTDDELDEPQPAALVRVRARTRALEQSRRALEDGIVDAFAQGYSLRQIGRAAGMSHERIRQILRERYAAATRESDQARSGGNVPSHYVPKGQPCRSQSLTNTGR